MRISELNEKEVSRAKNAAYRHLMYRPRSRAEVEQRLTEKGFAGPVVRSVLSDLERLGYIDDREFARQWAASRVKLRGIGRRRIEQELRNKGVGRESIREALGQAFEDSSEIDIARREAEKKARSLNRFEPEVRRRRLAGFLERRGFSSDIIRVIMHDVLLH